jgi:16S rRNA processing protein RimM
VAAEQFTRVTRAIGVATAERVTLARILRPQGRRGEVAAEILTDFPERLKNLKQVMLWDGRAEPRSANVRSCWLSHSRGGQAIFHFEGSDSISDAEKLVGLQVQIPIEQRVALPQGSYFITDLIGCEVFDVEVNADARDASSIGRVNPIGHVNDVQFTGESVAGTPILVVDTPRGELLVPLAQEICVRIDVAARRIDVNLPDGLRDLNS